MEFLSKALFNVFNITKNCCKLIVIENIKTSIVPFQILYQDLMKDDIISAI
jgi:hypothetical protein